jgi:hypothetical protein
MGHTRNMIQNGLTNVSIMPVSELYDEFERMDVPDYYKDGEVNPYAGRVEIIPFTATYYTMVPERDELALEMARAMLKGVAKRKKIREAIVSKAKLNYNQFSKASEIVVLYV